jgi:hypothetical protein
MREKVAIYRGSALTTLIFIVIMDVISDDNGEDVLWSVMFADDLVACDLMIWKRD